MELARCLFVVGTGRSGTTALYEFLCSHPDATWLSNWSQRVAPLGLLHPRGTEAGKERAGARWRFRPVEGYRVFDRALQMDGSGHLVARSAGRIRMLRAEIGLHRVRRWGGRAPVFVSKNTRNTRAVPVLEGLLPGSRYVDLVRNPLDTVASMVRVAFFQDLALTWDGRATTVRDAVAHGADPVAIAAQLWNDETALALADLATIDPDRVLRIRYEDLVADPGTVLHTVGTFAGLDPDRHPGFARRAAEFAARPSVARDPAFVDSVERICGATAVQVGYSDLFDR